MEKIQPEQIQNPREIIKLNQRFLLFDPKRTRQLRHGNETGVYISDIILDLEPDLSKLQIGTIAEETEPEVYRTEKFTPFDPGIGYRVTDEDLKLETRIAKKKRLDSIEDTEDERMHNEEHKRSPLDLIIGSTSEELLASNFIEDAGRDNIYGIQQYKSKPEIIDAVSRLRIQVFFPRSAYEARVSLNADDGCITVREYYPLETGPLASSRSPYLPEGLDIYLPDNPEKLQQIWGKFILLDEEQTEGIEEDKGVSI